MNPFEMTPHTNDYFVSFDKKLLDEVFVIDEIRHSYWGGWRNPGTILTSIEHSLCAGLYWHQGEGKPDKQVGFARVVTDYATFAWICDVLVTKAHRKKGLGKFLMSAVMAHPEVEPRACLLRTQDAHGLYAKYGFENCDALRRLPTKGKE